MTSDDTDVAQLAAAAGRMIADAAPEDEALERSFGSDHVVPRSAGFVAAVRALAAMGSGIGREARVGAAPCLPSVRGLRQERG